MTTGPDANYFLDILKALPLVSEEESPLSEADLFRIDQMLLRLNPELWRQKRRVAERLLPLALQQCEVSPDKGAVCLTPQALALILNRVASDAAAQCLFSVGAELRDSQHIEQLVFGEARILNEDGDGGEDQPPSDGPSDGPA